MTIFYLILMFFLHFLSLGFQFSKLGEKREVEYWLLAPSITMFLLIFTAYILWINL